MSTIVLAAIATGSGTLGYKALQAPKEASLPSIASAISDIGQPLSTGSSDEPVPQVHVPGHYAIITERPLFAPERRPDLPERTTVPPPEARLVAEAEPIVVLPTLTLRGVMLDEDRRAALLEGVDGTVDWYREGATLQQWKLERIEQSAVFFRLGDRTETVPLRPHR